MMNAFPSPLRSSSVAITVDLNRNVAMKKLHNFSSKTLYSLCILFMKDLIRFKMMKAIRILDKSIYTRVTNLEVSSN